MHTDARSVLDFWFGDGTAERAEWFRKDAAFDALIRDHFGALIEAVLAGRRFGDTAPERLAALIVLDQFTRNVFRDTPKAFAGDPPARVLALAMTERGDDLQLPPLQRSFVYLPFEHAEDLALQDRAVRCFEALLVAAPELESSLEYAHKHREVIRRFGRFPHRNTTLGRESTPAEIEFLAQPGSRF
jgi:uncharacterized protein (DUF924 family)